MLSFTLTLALASAAARTDWGGGDKVDKGKGKGDGKVGKGCCSWDECGVCGDPDDYCSTSKVHCNACGGGTWCDGGDRPTPHHRPRGKRPRPLYVGDAVESLATGFVPYFDAATNQIAGRVFLVSGDDGETTFTYEFEGLDNSCDGGPISVGSCEFHVHMGYSCDSDAFGHLYDAQTDPYTGVSVYTSSDGASAGTVVVSTGLDFGDVLGRALVLHSGTGKVACAVIESAKSATATDFVPYFDYTTSSEVGDLDVSGHVSIESGALTQLVVFDLEGVDPRCDDGAQADTPNSCGVHIHAGVSCESDAGPHFYDESVGEDPWVDVVYVSETFDVSGETVVSTEGQVIVKSGASALDVRGRAFVIHDYDGKRVACALVLRG
ncbi:hypothetical protein M885DRAFT_565192 [Pelagophyceae sp. CCMP2097]|nr:hypothetical protein M885DRAFT_565192 [Pelagophyceae sp. CCMP2097]